VRNLSKGALIGLFYIQRYRFLTIAQFAKTANFSVHHAGEVLRGLERWGAVGYFGFVSILGQGKTPKVYYLKRKGWELLRSEHSIYEEHIGSFSDVHKEATWTPQMYHRLRIIDVMIAAECAVQTRQHLAMIQTFLSYRMVKKGRHVTRETTDYVGAEETSENKLVPDGAFILENIQAQKRALFFVEMDMATERIASHIKRDTHNTIHHKLMQYDRYLKSMRYTQTYKDYGEFRSFLLLFITLNGARVENIRNEMSDLPAELGHYYRFTTFDQAMRDFLGTIWKSRLPSDAKTYPLVKEETDG